MLFKNENPVLGTTTSVTEIGTDASTHTGVSAAYKPTTREVITAVVPAAGTIQYVFRAPWKCKVVAARFNGSTVSSDTTPPTLDLQRVTADGTAPNGSPDGVTIIDLLASTLNLHTFTVNTNVNLSLSTASGSPLVLNAGDEIAIFIGGHVATALAGAYVQIEIAQLG